MSKLHYLTLKTYSLVKEMSISIIDEDMITLWISWRQFCIFFLKKMVLTSICELHQIFSNSAFYSEHFHIGSMF